MVLIDKFPVGLNFEDESDKVQLTNPVDLGESWTVETWLSLSSASSANLAEDIQQKLQASDPQQDARFGNSVAVSGNNAIIGAYQEGSKAGTAYIFERDDNDTWLEKQKLQASDGSAGDLFGRSVAISGNVAIVGADDQDTGGRSAGAAYIFERDDHGTWTEKAKIQASNKGASDNFGYAVAISNNFAIVGAYGEDTKGSNAGAAYIFERDTSGSWSETQKLLASDGSANDNFGNSLAISDNFAIVGAWKEDTGGSNAGSAYIFERDDNGTWSETKKLLASDGSADDRFGRSVAISNNIAIVGADNEATGGKSTGAAYIFERDGSGSWSEKIKLQASDKQEWDNFGYSVAVSGSLAIVGAYGKDTEANNAGAAYIFERDGSGTWTESQKLQASDGSAEDNFGRTVALSDNFAMIGALGKDTGGSGAGAAYIFAVKDQPISELANKILEQKIKTSEPKGNDNFGTSVAVSENIAIVGATTPPRMYHPVPGSAYIIEPESNETEAKIQQLQASDAKILDNFGASVAISGSIAIIGAPGANTAYIFEQESNGTWLEKQKLQGSDIKARAAFGCSVAISGNIALVGALSEDTGASNAGAAYIFERDTSGTWTERAKIQASDKQASDQFGWSVAISGNIALVGALTEDTGGSNAGAAYIFKRDTSGTWTETQKLQASDPEVNDFFGVSVAINGDFAIVGAPREDMGGNNAGAAYIFECDSNGNWSQSKKILASDPEPDDLFGHSVAINDNLAIVGARKKDTGGSDAGAAYIFECDSNGIWQSGKKILASDAKSGDEFGHSVAIGDNFAIVGSPKEDTGGSSAGAAYIFAVADVPAPKSAKQVLLASSNGDSPVVIQDLSQLGTIVDGVFYDSGYNLEQLTPGWHHLTAVAQDTTTKFYLDGQKIADVKQALLDAAPDDASRQQLEATICKTTADLSTIGDDTSGSEDLATFKLAEVRVWNQALSESEIAANSNKVRLTGNEAGLTAYYPMNEATGTEVVDRSNANNGTVTGANWWCGTVPIDNLNNSVMQFDGVNDYIDLGDEVVLGDHFTESAWIYSTSTDNGYHGFLGQHASRRAPSLWICQQNKIHGDFNEAGRLRIKTSNVMFADAWNHVAVTYDGVDYKVYVNGEECYAKNLSNEPASTTPIKYIGKVDNYFKGQIAEVRIWNKTRTIEEIRADMYQRLTGNESDLVAYLPLNQIQTEGGTQKVSDLSSNNNHGTVHGATLESSNTMPIS